MVRLDYAGGDGCPLCAFSTQEPHAAAASQLPVLVLMHGGGPDHRSLVPLAERLGSAATVVLPDVRGYGRSVCADEARHTWAQYADDVVSLLDRLRASRAVVGGAGLGATVALRTAMAYPGRVSGLVLISVEDIEDDAAKAAELAFMAAFAERMRTRGVEAAWAPILADLSPVIGAMVREAMPDANPASLAAAAAIGRDRAFRHVDELLGIQAPTLVFAGADWRHPVALAKALAERLPRGRMARASMSDDLRSTEDFARAFAPEIEAFLRELRRHD
ncbi:MAG TPA: alpha/beta hydrolase [Polyangiaceae bacterium]|nr:alpha/beta hydrolase [Polyangiaceae bacterium]